MASDVPDWRTYDVIYYASLRPRGVRFPVFSQHGALAFTAVG